MKPRLYIDLDVMMANFEKNCIPWRERGGIAIRHENFVDTSKQIADIFEV
jgi:hypothetical protein